MVIREIANEKIYVHSFPSFIKYNIKLPNYHHNTGLIYHIKMESINNNNDFSIRETTMDTSKHESLNRYKYFMKGFGMVFVVALSCLYVMEHVLSPILQLNAKDHDHLQKSSMNENDAHLTHLMNPLYSRVMNVDESPSSSKNDVAFFFHVPMSAGTIMKDIFSTCYLHLLKGEIDHYPPNKVRQAFK